MGSLRKLENSSIVILPPLQEQAMLAKLSNSFFTLSHFNLNLQQKQRLSLNYNTLKILCVMWVTSLKTFTNTKDMYLF